MFVPSNFTVDKGTTLSFTGCTINHLQGNEGITFNSFKSHFDGDIELDGWEIWTQDTPHKFIDKFEAYSGSQEELLV